MGKIENSFKTNKTANQRIKAICETCGAETNHLVLQSADTEGSEVVFLHDGDPDKPQTIDWSDNFQIIQCQGCDEISFRHVNWFSENQEYCGPENSNDGTTVSLYPMRRKDQISVRFFNNAPSNLQQIYSETIDCFNKGNNILCAAGLRAIVEGLCAHQGVTDGPVEVADKVGGKKIIRKDNLQGKISGLSEKGFMTNNNADLLHQHRCLGNEAVHELSQSSAGELRLAIEILEHTLEWIYEIPDKADQLREKIAARSPKK